MSWVHSILPEDQLYSIHLQSQTKPLCIRYWLNVRLVYQRYWIEKHFNSTHTCLLHSNYHMNIHYTLNFVISKNYAFIFMGWCYTNLMILNLLNTLIKFLLFSPELFCIVKAIVFIVYSRLWSVLIFDQSTPNFTQHFYTIYVSNSWAWCLWQIMPLWQLLLLTFDACVIYVNIFSLFCVQQGDDMMKMLTSSQACRLDATETSRYLDVDPSRGLDTAEVVRRRAVHGHNDFEIAEETPLWKKYLEQVQLYATLLSGGLIISRT